MTDSGESKLPLQYEDGPDFCTVRDAQGRDFALTMQPELMKAMEKALSNETASFKRPPVQCSSAGSVTVREVLASLYPIMDSLEAFRGDKNILRISGLVGDAQDVGIATVETTREAIAGAVKVLQGIRDEPQEASKPPAGYVTADYIKAFAKELRKDTSLSSRQSADLIETLYLMTLGARDDRSWQPIETAPKDPEATFLVCAVGDDRGPFVVRSDIMWQARKAGTPSHLGLSYLTHWMPLPEMPQ